MVQKGGQHKKTIFRKLTTLARRDFSFFIRHKLSIALLVVGAAGAALVAMSSPVYAAPTTWQCTTDGILTQSSNFPDTSDVVRVDMAGGKFTTVGDIGRHVNSIGYNVLDDFIYGVERFTNAGSNAARVVRIGANLETEVVIGTATMGSSMALAGDVDDNGHYWLFYSGAKEWQQIDLATGTILDSGTSTGDIVDHTGPYDWTYIPGTDSLYTVAHNPSEDRHSLLRFDRTTKVFEEIADLGLLVGGLSWGATYTSPDGYLYAYQNLTGNIRRFDVTTGASVAFSQGDSTSLNDGARCFNAPIPVDYGDAIDSYGTMLDSDGARHSVIDFDNVTNTAPVMLGSLVDLDSDGFAGAAASGDDTDNIADEESVSGPIYIYEGETTDVDVTVTNDSSEDVTLAGWIDLDSSGTFDVGERVTQTILAESGTQTVTLNFPAGTTDDDSFARFRVFSEVVADPLPTGAASGGEVEDFQVFAGDVQFTKTVSPNTTSALPPGGTFTYTVTVENIGSAPLTGLSFTDDLTNVVDDATYNTDVTADIGTAVFNSPDQIEWNGDLAVSETATITYSVTVGDPIPGDGVLVNGVVGDGAGSNCTDDPAVDADCLTRVPQPDISSSKEILSPAGNPQAGDTVTYRFTIVNNGSGATTGVVVSDDLSGVLDDATYNNDVVASTGTATFNAGNQRLNWQGDLAANGDAGDTVTVDYSVTINDAYSLNDGVLQNGLISADCPNPPIYDSSDPDFDAECVAIAAVEAWITTKTANPSGPVSAGGNITYTIEAENTGGVDLTGLSFNDDLTQILDDANYNNDQSATVGSATYTAPTVTWNGDLAVGETSTITYSATVNAADSLGDGMLNNAVTGSSNCPSPAVTNPLDPDYNIDCVQINETRAWVVSKVSDATSPVSAGDTIGYTVTIENTGTADLTSANPATFTDNLSNVIDDATYNEDASAVVGEVLYDQPQLTWEGALVSGGLTTVTYSVTVNEASADGDGVILNALTGGQCPSPAVTNPGDPNFNADCVTSAAVSEWMATKSVDPVGAINPGDTLTYTLTVTNTGGADLTGLDAPSLADDLTEVLDDATYNGDHAATAGVANYTEPTMSWGGDLSVDQTATITYSVTTHGADDLGDATLTNALAGAPNCADPVVTDPSSPDYDANCAAVNYIAAFTVTKTADPEEGSTVHSGDIVRYTIEIENTGALDFTDFTYIDDMSDVLDDARFDDSSVVVTPSSAGATTLSGTDHSFDGDVPVGQTVTVSYAVEVNKADEIGNGVIRNVVFAPFANCANPNNPDCSTTHTYDPNSSLADSGQNIFISAIVAAVAIVAAAIVYLRIRATARA